MDDHNQNINLDEINIDNIIGDNQSEHDGTEDNFNSDDFNETPFIPCEEEITINDSDLRRIEERYESDLREMENLRIEYSKLHRDCQQKKQEIQILKDIAFSSDCRNDKEIIYSSIETETCKSIKEHAFQISQNIRANRRIAKRSLDNLKQDTDLLTLQFDYTGFIEDLLVTQSDYNKLKSKCDQVKPIISGFDAIRKERKKQACREKEVSEEIKKAEDIMNQQ